MTDSKDAPGLGTDGSDRRGFLSSASSWFMAGGLATGYGACGAMGARYLFPARPPARAWLFVARTDELKVGDALDYRSPSGQKIAIARQGDTGTVEDFVALSSTCPHLGCQVHWESQNERFFCPCHNGAFDPSGNPIAGPPAEANQPLPRFDLKIEKGLLYIEVPVESLARSGGESGSQVALRPQPGRSAPPGPGHDPCLYPDPPDTAPTDLNGTDEELA